MFNYLRFDDAAIKWKSVLANSHTDQQSRVVPEGKIVPGTALIHCIKKQFINDGFRPDLEMTAENHNILRLPQHTTAQPSFLKKRS
jgi:hypothetical protein